MKISIRKWTLSDIDNLVEHANNRNISDQLADAFPFPYDRAFGLNFIKKASADRPTKIFAITINDEAIGSIGIFPDMDVYRKNAAIAYWVAEPHWGKGVATKAINLILEYGFETWQLKRIYAKPYGNNTSSHRVLEKSGFKLEAVLRKTVLKNGVFLDEKIYGLRKQ